MMTKNYNTKSNNNKVAKKIGWLFFDSKTKTALLHRCDHRTKDSPNMWDCFGGNIEKNEKPLQAFKRELFEEMDIVIPNNEAIRFMVPTKVFAGTFYYVNFPDWLTRSIRLGEGAGYAWFSIKDALKLKNHNVLTDEAYRILLKFQKNFNQETNIELKNDSEIQTTNLANKKLGK